PGPARAVRLHGPAAAEPPAPGQPGRARPGHLPAGTGRHDERGPSLGFLLMGEFVNLETDGGIGTIRLNRPKVNALNDQVTAELAGAAREAAASDEVRAVIVYGGEKVFCGGADIEVMAEAGYAEMALRSGRLQEATGLVAAIGKPVV